MHKLPDNVEATQPNLDELGELGLEDIPSLRTSFWSRVKEHGAVALTTLPYEQLDGQAFERLCYHLLLADGVNVRFWGRRGHAQYGIDLIFSDGEAVNVYQCKNVVGYGASDLRTDLNFFRQEWLVKRPHLPRPGRFVFFCSAQLTERDKWEEQKRHFWENTRVHVEEWHRTTLDTKLRQQPDIVADLFGDNVAALFCEREDWNIGLFRPLLPGRGDEHIDRYLHLQAAGRIVRNGAVAKRLADILNKHGITLVEGLSGSGKTITSLDLAQRFEDAAWRVFLMSLRNDTTEDNIFNGIKDRSVRRTIFVLDDCHRDYEKVSAVISRVRATLQHKSVRIVLTARTAPSDTEFFEQGRPELVDDLREDQQIITLRPTVSQYVQIISRAKPWLTNIPREWIERLFELTAHDLFLFDIVLESIEDKAIAEELSFEDLFPRALRRYFGSERPLVPHFKQLAAVAQFDLSVPCSLLPLPLVPERYHEAVERLALISNRPPSWNFIHSSAAELIFHALSWADADADSAKAAAKACKEVFLKQDIRLILERDLPVLLRTRLSVGDDLLVKQALLTDPDFVEHVSKIEPAVPPSVLSLAAFFTRDLSPPTPYADWLVTRIEGIVQGKDDAEEESLDALTVALRALEFLDPVRQTRLEETLSPRDVMRLISTRGTVFDLLKAIRISTPGYAAKLISQLDEASISRFIDNTILSGRSVGTLWVKLRQFAERQLTSDPKRTELEALVECLGTAPMLRLIKMRGTLFDLLRLLDICTPGYAEKVIAALDESMGTELVEKTIRARRSIGTFNISLRELGARKLQSDPTRSQLHAFEEWLGEDAMLRLIEAQGIMGDLLSILAKSTPSYSGKLIAKLDEPKLRAIIERSISSHRPIGALGFHLRDLGRREMPAKPGRTQLDAFEEQLGAQGLWTLVDGAGDLNELAYLIDTVSPSFRQHVLSPDELPDLDGWRRILRRGDLYSAVRFLRDAYSQIPAESRALLQEAISHEAVAVVTESPWPALASGFAILSDAKVSNVSLRDAALRRIEGTDLDNLTVHNFTEGCAALSCLWNVRREVRSTIARDMWMLIPPEDEWPNDYELFVSGRHILTIARSLLVTNADSVRIVRAFARLPKHAQIEHTYPRPLFLFLWNLFALWYERGLAVAVNFEMLQPEQVWSRLLHVIEEHAARRGRNQDKLNCLALVGILAFCVPSLRPQLRSAIRNKVRGVRWLMEEADANWTFIPAFFAYQGLAQLLSDQQVFSPDRCAQLLHKAEDYEERGPAIEHICDWIKPRLAPASPNSGRY